VASGASRAFTITPATGYKVSNVLVDGASVGAVITYTFSNITANHTISASFIIATSSVTAVKVLSPNGGELFYTGETKTVSWEAPAGISSFSLSYSKNNGYTWTTIANTIKGTTHQWSVPQLTKTYSKCKVRVIGYNTNGKEVGRDKSGGTFTIEIR
jgi:hypothetical protein